jgi:DNA-directed RNA polymerase omega subunit
MFIEPVDLRQIDREAANIYEAAIVAAKRARQINDDTKIEYNALVSTIPAAAGDEEGEEFDNPAQMKIALEFEKREKPHIQALKELLEGKVEFEYKNKSDVF